MDFEKTMTSLKKLGTSQNIKVYKRHGAGDNLFGVSFANLNKLKKQIQVDHELARQLWNTANTDAMTLATMVADPDGLTASEADNWLKDIDYYVVADSFCKLIAKSKAAVAKIKKWAKSKQEFTRQCGFGVLCVLLKDAAERVPDELCLDLLARIEREIHQSPNRARHTMNMALISIGLYKPHFRTQVLESGRRIGKVDVDHGETGCKTPDAVSYLQKAARQKSASKRPRRKT